MPYTTSSLATFMAVELGAVGTVLGLTDGSEALDEAVNEVAAILGAAIDALTDDLKTRTVARWQAWRVAKGAASGQFDLKAGSVDLKQSQVFKHIDAMLRDAELAAARYGDVAVVIGGRLPAPVPYAGGLTVSDKQTREGDTDRVPPFFTRTLHEAQP